MKYIADLHTHSLYSRATSKQCDLNGFFNWAQIKGIHLLGTGDFTHPVWFEQLKSMLQPVEGGFFKLKEPPSSQSLDGITPSKTDSHFMLSTELSCIYKKKGQVRKIHCLLYVPDFDSVTKINSRLRKIGNIDYDGRPILGLDVKNLLEILLECSPEGFMVPAHIWTPWFSLFGSKSGFDRIEDCFEDLTEHIFALETGLSADPEMIRLISDLDRFSLISNSDCHSPWNLGREANLFDTGFDFSSLKKSLMNPGTGFNATIEFFPENGKYFSDGHRKCGISYSAEEIFIKGTICSACNKPLTLGVMRRVSELADRKEPVFSPEEPKSIHMIPLTEVLSEMLGVGSKSKKVQKEYSRVISLFGSEFNLLLNTPIEEIKKIHSERLGIAIDKIRQKKVFRSVGFDGIYGEIRIFNPEKK
ncbi:MAG: endonuclease Q family protein [Deltaproteobacteria bacterium]|nr:endonuclease Q family protein [Deltaproteobacteria bacterium]